MNLKENPMGFLAGKRILVTGLISNRSIAYGVAQSCRAQGAELAFTYQNERFQERVTEMAAEFGSSLVFPCDVAEDAQIDALFSSLRTRWDGLDGLVHAIAFESDCACDNGCRFFALLIAKLQCNNELRGEETTRKCFGNAGDHEKRGPDLQHGNSADAPGSVYGPGKNQPLQLPAIDEFDEERIHCLLHPLLCRNIRFAGKK